MSHRRLAVLSTCGILTAALVTGCTNASETTPTPGPNTQSSDGSSNSWSPLTIDTTARELLPQRVIESGELIVASDPTYPPFEYYASDNKTIVGWDVDFSDAIGEVLGVKIVHVPATFDTILPGLQSGKYDVGMSAFSVTAERQKVVDFVPYLTGGSALAVAKGNPEGLEMEPLSLCGKTIAAQKGTMQAQDFLPSFSEECEAESMLPIDIKVFPSQNDANLALTSGRVQGVMADSVFLAYEIKVMGERYELAPGNDYLPDLFGATLGKNSELLPALQAATQSVIESPAYQEINEHWGLPDNTRIPASDAVI